MTRITNEQIAADGVSERFVKDTRFQSIKIVDPVFEETDITHVIKKSTGWHG